MFATPADERQRAESCPLLVKGNRRSSDTGALELNRDFDAVGDLNIKGMVLFIPYFSIKSHRPIDRARTTPLAKISSVPEIV